MRRSARGGTSDDDEAASGQQDPSLPEVDLERARVAYRGSLDAARGWRSFSANTKHHDMTYWSLLSWLFIEPGSNRTTLLERIIDYAGVSRSTAERAIREARASGYIIDRPAGQEVRYFLSESVMEHCLNYFRNYLDLQKIVERRGYGSAD